MTSLSRTRGIPKRVVPPFWMLFEDEFSAVSMRDFGRGNERPLLPVEDKLGQWLPSGYVKIAIENVYL